MRCTVRESTGWRKSGRGRVSEKIRVERREEKGSGKKKEKRMGLRRVRHQKSSSLHLVPSEEKFS